MNRAERIYRLHELLKGRRPASLALLQKQLGEASRATVNRDIAYLREFFCAPVRYDRERNGYHYDPGAPAFELPGLFFNESELFALLASEQILEAVQPGILAPKLGPLRARIRQLLAESGHDAETVARRVLVRGFASRRSDPDRFGAIAAAVLAGHALNIQYHSRTRDQITRRRVHCARLVHYRANWYLLAWCEHAAGLRLFALERVRETIVDGAADEIPATERELERFVGASFGIFSGEAGAWARIRFTPEMARWVAEENWHSDQIGYWTEDDRYELQVPYSNPTELLMEVLKYGADAEVIGPPELRERVRKRLEQALRQYENMTSADGANR